jgi:hypothetical protein
MEAALTPIRSYIRGILITAAFIAFTPLCAFAQTPCPRPVAGSIVTPPPDLFSNNGVLNIAFNYYTTVDIYNRTLFCFVTPDGKESPTLHVNPGDTLNVTVTNQVLPAGSPIEVVANGSNQCGDSTMTTTSVNVHYHGTNTTPNLPWRRGDPYDHQFRRDLQV